MADDSEIDDLLMSLGFLLDKCAMYHQDCKHCQKIMGCQQLWDRISAISAASPLRTKEAREIMTELQALTESR